MSNNHALVTISAAHAGPSAWSTSKNWSFSASEHAHDPLRGLAWLSFCSWVIPAITELRLTNNKSCPTLDVGAEMLVHHCVESGVLSRARGHLPRCFASAEAGLRPSARTCLKQRKERREPRLHHSKRNGSSTVGAPKWTIAFLVSVTPQNLIRFPLHPRI